MSAGRSGRRAGGMRWALYAAKYIFYLASVALLASRGLVGHRALLGAAFEMLLVAACTELLHRASPAAAWLANSAALLVGNLQNTVMYFGSTFATPQMLANLRSIAGLGGHARAYALAAAAAAAASLLPVARVGARRRGFAAASCALAALLAAGVCLGGFYYSPYRSALSLACGAARQRRVLGSIRGGGRRRNALPEGGAGGLRPARGREAAQPDPRVHGGAVGQHRP